MSFEPLNHQRTAPLAEAPLRPADEAGKRSGVDYERDSMAPGGNTSPPAPNEQEARVENGRDARLEKALVPQLALDVGAAGARRRAPGLMDTFLVPPFSVFDTRTGYWQERRRAWLSLGMRGETTAQESYSPHHGDGPPSGVYQPSSETAARMRAAGEQVGGLKADHGGRKQELIFGHTAPGSDPGFYDRKRKAEVALGRELSTQEFIANHYDRDEELKGASEAIQTGTSVFDPVLCEIAYRWFSAEGHVIVDPFAGGVVRGLLAGVLGRHYAGVELRPEQIADNERQATDLLGGASPVDYGREPIVPRWLEGDARELTTLGLPAADLLFTCPPYADLETYSDDPRDLSTMEYAQFREAFADVMAQSAALLKPNRFSVWVVGEARGKDGLEYGFVPDVVTAAQNAGLRLYNTAILLNSVGSAALRARLIHRTRKLTRVHQTVLVFVKGDPREAAKACGAAELERHS